MHNSTYLKIKWALLFLFIYLNYNEIEGTPSLEFTNVPAFGSTNDLQGIVHGVTQPTNYGVAVYIKVQNLWWTKPYYAKPLSTVHEGGTWNCDISTGSGDEFATEFKAFLIVNTNLPPLAKGVTTLPSTLESITEAKLEFNREVPVREITFSGYKWRCKNSWNARWGPGPNYFSDSETNIWLDGLGRLHLKVTKHNNAWYCPEIISLQSFGFGIYQFIFDSSLDALDPNLVIGAFTWSDDLAYAHREIDIEFSRWGNASDFNSAQYVVQPFDKSGHLYRWPMAAVSNSIHTFSWNTNGVNFESREGAHLTNGEIENEIGHWNFGNVADIPIPGNESVHVNAWLYNGSSPLNGLTSEIVLSKFEFMPFSSVPIIGVGNPALLDDRFHLTITGMPGMSYSILCSTNLILWSHLATVNSAVGLIDWWDSSTNSSQRRYYRSVINLKRI